MDYEDLCALKTYLGIATAKTIYDARLSDLITQVSGLVDVYCDRTFGQQTYAEHYSGKGTQYLILRQRPVLSIASLFYDPKGYFGDNPAGFAANTLLTEGTDYALVRDPSSSLPPTGGPAGSSASGMVYRINGLWHKPFGRIAPVGMPTLANVPQAPNGNIFVTYTAGYAAVPGPVRLAVRLAVARLWQTGQFGAAVSSERYEDYGYNLATLNPDDILAPAKPFLANYKNVPI
jgi:hypothetical protein